MVKSLIHVNKQQILLLYFSCSQTFANTHRRNESEIWDFHYFFDMTIGDFNLTERLWTMLKIQVGTRKPREE